MVFAQTDGQTASLYGDATTRPPFHRDISAPGKSPDRRTARARLLHVFTGAPALLPAGIVFGDVCLSGCLSAQNLENY